MDSSTLLWTVDATRGSVNFGRLIPFAGNTYELVFAGVAIEEEYTAYVMDEGGLKCLAKSQHNAGEYTIAFNTADLRDEFERNMHEVQTFHVIVRDSKRVVAEGDLCVQWQSLWEDTTTGEVFTMRGPKGNPGTPGGKGDPGLRGLSAYDVAVNNGFDGSEEEWLKTLKGVPGSLTRVQKVDENGEETGKWHNVFVKLDQNGRLRIVIGKSEHEPDASNDVYVSSQADMSIGGTKTFLESPIVPVITDARGEVDVTDDSGKAANTKWIRKWWTKIWEGILSSAHKFTAECTFENGIIGNLKGNVKGDVEGTANKAIADKNGNKIDETYLPLSGGTMTEAIVKSGSSRTICRDTNDSATQITGGTDADKNAYLNLYGNNYPTEGSRGSFTLAANDGTASKRLIGKINGTLTWDGLSLETVNSIGSNYIRYTSGLQICWGSAGTGTPTTITLPKAFVNNSYVPLVQTRNTGGDIYQAAIEDRTTTTFKIYTAGGAADCGKSWMAIGKWK